LRTLAEKVRQSVRSVPMAKLEIKSTTQTSEKDTRLNGRETHVLEKKAIGCVLVIEKDGYAEAAAKRSDGAKKKASEQGGNNEYDAKTEGHCQTVEKKSAPKSTANKTTGGGKKMKKPLGSKTQSWSKRRGTFHVLGKGAQRGARRRKRVSKRPKTVDRPGEAGIPQIKKSQREIRRNSGKRVKRKKRETAPRHGAGVDLVMGTGAPQE